MDTTFRRTIKVLLNIFHWHGMCFRADCPKSDHFKTPRAHTVPHVTFSLQIAQGYIINSTYTHLCANTRAYYTQTHIVDLLLVKLDLSFLLDNMPWSIFLAFGFTCLLTSTEY